MSDAIFRIVMSGVAILHAIKASQPSINHGAWDFVGLVLMVPIVAAIWAKRGTF